MSQALCALLLAFALGHLAAPALAHEGHGDEPPPPANVAPRSETRSDLFEVVGVLGPDARLWIYIDRTASNEPVDGATVEVSLDGQQLQAARVSEGTYVLASPALAVAGSRNLIFTVTAGADIDLLPATLEVPTIAAGIVTTAGVGQMLIGMLFNPLSWAAAALALLLGIVVGRFSAPRPLAPMVEHAKPATAVADPHPARAGQTTLPARAAAPSVAMLACVLLLPGIALSQPVDPPRRQPDGSIFVPKPTQRLLGVRTAQTAQTDTFVALQLVGTVIADPNASGRVQAPQGGRVEAPEGGFPTLGSRVVRSQVLAFIVPILAAQERSGVQASLAELDAQTAIAQARVQRLSGLAGSVSAREISEARAELEGLRQRRAALGAGLNGREAVRAPADGVLSTINAVAGQIVDAREPMFDVVDPARLWIDAVAFDAPAVAQITSASAVTTGGQALRLTFIGRGFALRQQAVPLQFRIDDVPVGMSVGTPVTVTVQTPRRAEGIVLPAEAVVRNPEGGQIVFEMASAERFIPTPVRVQPLDARQVLVTAGLQRGARVVTTAAGLIAQVR